MLSFAGSRNIWLGVFVTALIACIPAYFGGVASAGTVDIFSNGQSGTNNEGGTNVNVAVSPAWAVAGPGYEWISYGATGCNMFVALTGTCTPGPQNPVGTTVDSTPTATFYQTFTITDSFDSGTLDVWADDTASVYIDAGTVTTGTGSSGTLLWLANGTLGGNCANQPIGCLPGMDAQIGLGLTSGTYTLVVDAYQLVGGSPFGVMYDGVLTNAPEPESYMLIGLGLAGLVTFMQRRKRA